MVDRTPWRVASVDGWKYSLLVGLDGFDGFTDVEVESPDGVRWVGTVATSEQVRDVMDRYVATGECLSGAYLWVSDFVLVRESTEELVIDVLRDLVRTGEIGSCFQEVKSAD